MPSANSPHRSLHPSAVAAAGRGVWAARAGRADGVDGFRAGAGETFFVPAQAGAAAENTGAEAAQAWVEAAPVWISEISERGRGGPGWGGARPARASMAQTWAALAQRGA